MIRYNTTPNFKTSVLLGCLIALFIFSCNRIKKNKNTLETTLKHHLFECTQALNKINSSKDLQQNTEHFKKARHFFKSAEPLLSFFDKENYKSLNSPNLLRVHEEDATDIKIWNPFGFQAIEETLLLEDDNQKLNSLIKQTSNRLNFIHNNLHINPKDYHLIWILRDGVIRIATTGLSNFDSPVLQQSLQESISAYDGLLEIIFSSEENFQNKKLYNDWLSEIKNTKTSLNVPYDTFDSYDFIQNHTNKQLVLLNKTIDDWQVKFPFQMSLNNRFNSMFGNDMFNLRSFSNNQNDSLFFEEKIILGKQLFNDRKLSLNNDMSCATCHIKDKAFTDGKKVFNQHQKRNTPTLTYAGLQRNFFHDGRAGNLEGQIVGVVNNHNEFASDLTAITNTVKENEAYSKAFDTLYLTGINHSNIRHAIASYIRSLNSFNSKFDNNINKKENTLSPSEKNGFNLFMGKAGCATCHFPPLFNGTVPPNFKESELELIGTPKNNNFENPILDNDFGRYDVFQTEERKHFFKTPTLRNISKTAPYMHNGVYNTLEEVVEFYDRGGGTGLGFDLAYQTLPGDSLGLTRIEKDAIIAFLKTLTDQ
ncbi:cytochrome-c peroxidase [Flavicella marina]|uniref:cytochrome-c peroxidase n=1 Tax=Flavicella marina TaxID=1475951 RepID=UPI001264CE25|nr:cytochrome c peroxidase [Flavicella marina]